MGKAPKKGPLVQLKPHLFSLEELHPDEFKFTIYSKKYHKEIGCMFDEMLFDKNKYNKTNIAIIEGLQFLSMCALHYENAVRQKALWLQGLIILNDFVAWKESLEAC